MKIYTKGDIYEIENKYRNGIELGREDKIWYQNMDGTRRSGINYFMDSNELGEYAKSFSDVNYFANNHCKIKLEDGNIGKIKLRDYQKDAIKHVINNRYSIFLISRQVGLTISKCIVFLHNLLFKDNQKIIIFANKSETSKEFLRKIKGIYKLLPFYLKCGVISWNEKNISFENGSQIEITTNRSTLTIEDYDIIHIEEFSHIPKNIILPLFEKILLKLKESGKFIISSSPNGVNLFYELVQDSERRLEDPKKNVFETLRTYYWQVPGRDQKWVDEQINMIGSETLFKQEYELCFISNNDFKKDIWNILNTIKKK